MDGCVILNYTLDHISFVYRTYSLEDRSQTKIQVKLLSILASKLDEHANGFKPVKFNISANLEEAERGANKVLLKFVFTIVTDPRVVKYQVEGRTEIEGELDNIKKALTLDPSTKVPMILYDIYQQVYAPIFVLSKTIDAPCPSPELLSISPAMPSAVQEISQDSQAQTETEEPIAPDEKISA